jgi:hypothetical protein
MGIEINALSVFFWPKILAGFSRLPDANSAGLPIDLRSELSRDGQ